MSRSKIMRRIAQYVKVNYKKLDINNFIMGACPYNHRCHINAVQTFREGKASKVLLVIAIDKFDTDSITVHFINELQDGKFQDNTWGWLYEQYDYYLIREVDRSEYDTIWKILTATKKMIININTNSIERFLFRISPDSI